MSDVVERFDMKADCPCFKHVIAIAPSGKMYRYKNAASISLEPSIIPRSKIFDGVDQFGELEASEIKKIANERELDAFNYIPRDAKKVPKQTLAMAVWLELCKRADLVTKSAAQSAGGERKSTLNNRVYIIDRKKMAQSLADLPTQAITCLQLMWSHDSDQISEGALKELITSNATKLNTRQDPWRIFQYYRAKLNELGFFRMQ
jgi:hypothetical protein